jgi:diadenosine tetraphosphate (Ap4A) HIT family hydrolase
MRHLTHLFIVAATAQISTAWWWSSKSAHSHVDQYLESISVSYGDLRARAESKEGIEFVPKSSIPGDAQLVRVGFHGTSSKAAKAIAQEGIKPSADGLTGPRVYTTPHLRYATLYALKAALTNGGIPAPGSHDSICHMFAFASDAKELKLRVATKKQFKTLVRDKIFRGLEAPFHDDVIVSHRQTDFPGASADKLIAFCEPLPSYGSQLNFLRHWFSLFMKNTFLSMFESSLVKQYKATSVINDIQTMDFKLLAKLTSQKGKTMDTSEFTDEERCPFCKKAAEDTTDANVIVIPDANPMAEHHMLAIPKSHRPSSVLELTREHIPLVRELQKACQDYFAAEGIDASEAVYGFHIPKFTSVEHLHMHCLVPPMKIFYKYDEKFFPFISINSLIEILESGRRVKSVGAMKFFWKYYGPMVKEAHRRVEQSI